MPIEIIVLISLISFFLLLLLISIIFVFYEKDKYGFFDWDEFICFVFVFSVPIVVCSLLCATFTKCPSCDYISNDDFCARCGTDLDPKIVCDGCNEEYSLNYSFDYCHLCGTKLVREPANP